MKINRKNKLTIPLVALTFVLWGFILYKVIVYFTSQRDEETKITVDTSLASPKPAKNNTGPEEEISYQEIDRDPFTFRKKPPLITDEIISANKTPPPPPKPQLIYKINGVIINNNSKLIVFEDKSNNKTLFLREKDTYNGIKIVSINVNKVVITEDKKTVEIVVGK